MEAETEQSAFEKTKALGINPGGEAAIFDITHHEPTRYPRNVLLQKADFERIDGEPGIEIGDMSEEERSLLDRVLPVRICEDHNA